MKSISVYKNQVMKNSHHNSYFICRRSTNLSMGIIGVVSLVGSLTSCPIKFFKDGKRFSVYSEEKCSENFCLL